MSRGYKQRCEERVARLVRRAQFLTARITSRPDIECVHDKQERSAVLWAIEEVERWAVVAAILDDEQLDDAGRVATIRALLRSRLRPSEADVARTPGLARALKGRTESSKADDAVAGTEG